MSVTEPTVPAPLRSTSAAISSTPVRALTSKARPFKNEGLELPTMPLACEEATTACGDTAQLDGALRSGDGWQMEVTDANGKAILLSGLRAESE